MTDVDLDHLDSSNVAAAIDKLRHEGVGRTVANPLTLRLDLSSAPEAGASAVLAGALMTGLRTVPICIDHPDSSIPIGHVVRSGLATAFNARGKSTIFRDPDSPLRSPEWGSTWTPGLSAFRTAMFRDDEDVAPAMFGSKHAVFINPHRTTTPPGPSSITRLIRRWLAHRLTEVPAADSLLIATSFAVDQLVVNVSEHAVTNETPSVTSVVRVEIDDLDPEPAITIAALDTGAGIAKTLRPKLDNPPLSDVDLLTSLLGGGLPGWGRARGIGLARITQLVQEVGGAMQVQIQGASATVTNQLEVDTAPEILSGSVVALRLPLKK